MFYHIISNLSFFEITLYLGFIPSHELYCSCFKYTENKIYNKNLDDVQTDDFIDTVITIMKTNNKNKPKQNGILQVVSYINHTV